MCGPIMSSKNPDIIIFSYDESEVEDAETLPEPTLSSSEFMMKML